MYSEDDLLPLSALQHLVFCERRAALVHIECQWGENKYTAEGRHLHDRTHVSATESRGEVRIARGLALRSLRLGLAGKADVVEFHLMGEIISDHSKGNDGGMGIMLPGIEGFWRVLPVEYKRGKKRHEEAYEVQLCAQALCLEEMLGVEVHVGALYYGKSGHRVDLVFSDRLRRATETAVNQLHNLIESGLTPKAEYGKKCEKCSMNSFCMPKIAGTGRSANKYLESNVKGIKE